VTRRLTTRDQATMKTPLLLRIASVISLLFAVGHSLGGLQRWSPVGENAVLEAMTDVHFDTMGVRRSYLDFYMGLGWTISILMLMETILLWQLASLATRDPARLRSIIAVIAVATAASGVIAWRFILPVPALFSVALLLPLVLAYVSARDAGATAG
jgi:hypothetical protein